MKEKDRQPSGKADRRRDISRKTVLGNPILCAQFLRDNINIPCFKDVRSEDIEDVSERYRPYLGTEYESDTVKRIWLRGEPLFLISLTEHKSQVDYDVSMQLLKYMLCIWLDYAKEMERKKEGASDRKGFRYPAIIPVVYYEGRAPWTAERRFRGRISGGERFRKWVPDFGYEVVRLHDYSNEELLERGDEMSLIMLFNKIQNGEDLTEFLKLPKDRLNEMVKDTPESVLDIIVSVMESLCGKIDATEKETQECVSRVRERRMGYLFENMEKMSIQEERRNTAQARAELERMKENMVQSLISACKELGATREKALEKIMKDCHLDEETARRKINTYWNV